MHKCMADDLKNDYNNNNDNNNSNNNNDNNNNCKVYPVVLCG